MTSKAPFLAIYIKRGHNTPIYNDASDKYWDTISPSRSKGSEKRVQSKWERKSFDWVEEYVLFIIFEMQGKEINRGADVRSKNGVFLFKDQKIAALEMANQQLRLELQREVEEFNQLNKESADVRSKHSSLQTQNSFQEIEQAMLQQSIHKSQQTIVECQAFLQQSTPKIAELNDQISLLQQELQTKMKESTQSGNLIKRYGEEIRNQKLILKSDKNLTKIAQNFRKSHENYEKNLQILRNKLQGKKKYLMILTKKVNKQKQSEKVEEQANARLEYGQSRVRTKMEENKRYVGNLGAKEKEQEKKEDKQAMKSYNDIIRKKNAILAQKK